MSAGRSFYTSASISKARKSSTETALQIDSAVSSFPSLVKVSVLVQKWFLRAMISIRLREVLTTKPTEIERLPFEGKCLLEVMQEVIAGIGDGVAGDVPYTVTKEMVDAKVREKTQKQK
jgi:hypothetical protein